MTGATVSLAGLCVFGLAAPSSALNFTPEEARDAGNAVVAELYSGTALPIPQNMGIWPTVDITSNGNQGMDIQMSTTGTCAMTWIAQSTSHDFAANTPIAGEYGSPDVNRPTYVSGVLTQQRFTADPQLSNGYMITRAPATGETPTTTSGRVKVTGADAGSTSLALDGWIDTRQGVGGDYVQNSRLRMATSVEITNFKMILRVDDASSLRTTVTGMANWNGWWAPGYTQAPSGNFTITYETVGANTFAVITANVIPANTWATVTFEADVPVATIGAPAPGSQPRFSAFAAASADFPYVCEPPLPAWNESTIAPGETANQPSIGDAVPPTTTAVTYEPQTTPAGWTVTIDQATAALTAVTPPGTPLGSYQIPVLVTFPDGSTRTVHATVHVKAGAGGGLAATGAEPATGLIVAALGVLALGFGLLRAAPRRRRS